MASKMAATKGYNPKSFIISMFLPQINDFCFCIYVLGYKDFNEKYFRKKLYTVIMVTLEISADKPQKNGEKRQYSYADCDNMNLND